MESIRSITLIVVALAPLPILGEQVEIWLGTGYGAIAGSALIIWMLGSFYTALLPFTPDFQKQIGDIKGDNNKHFIISVLWFWICIAIGFYPLEIYQEIKYCEAHPQTNECQPANYDEPICYGRECY